MRKNVSQRERESMEMKEFYLNELDVRLSGRMLFRDNALYILHAAGFVEFEFVGKRIEAEIESEGGNDEFEAWMGIYVDDLEHFYQRVSIGKGSKWYLLWSSEEARKIRIRIVKLSENQYAYMAIKKIRMDKEAVVTRVAEQAKRIEFIGDSITCGYGNEGKVGDGFLTKTENPLKAYAVLTAQKLNCDFTLVAWSGIGVISSWVEPMCEEPNTEVLAPIVYPYVDFSLYSRMGWEPKEYYAYEEDRCDLIVVNLGTNDASYTKEYADRKNNFLEGYVSFLRYLRQTHAEKPIVCTAGAILDTLNAEIEEAVRRVQIEAKDPHLYYMQFSPKNAEDGEGAVGHPSLLRHEKMASQLADWIQKNVIF